ncbi:HlyD family secretion protein [Planctomyces sp. SH-PL62]|uniref:HlyD family secretion protein n=1 Tax=Planctomyces sp. SH-PL62 TaxID=1636152 RepID=UPI00078EE137|nr:HlyD family secretion protein [Planctomyces sp. SH-PL62]AMV41031.1 Multidrug export protein EmrA [Planctomyces sp. SH-PL62]
MPRLWASGRSRLLLLMTTLSFGGAASYWWWNTRTDVYTDNAYVVCNITPIASNVTGQVVALFVDDNMIVQPGDPIAQINPVEFQIAVDQALAGYYQAGHAAEAAEVTTDFTTDDRKSLLVAAQAKRAESEQMVEAARVAVQTHTRLHEKEKEVLAALEAQMPGLEAMRRNAQYYYERFKSLAESGDIPGQEFDNRDAAYRAAVAKVESLHSDIKGAERQVLASELELQEARVRLEQSRKALANTDATVGRAQAEQMQLTVAADTALALRNEQALAEAKLRQAKLDLSNTLIRAPRAGVIGRRTIQVGKTVEANKPFLSIVPLDFDNLWIVANLRENQMPDVRVGQPVKIAVDAVSDRTFDGWVESVAGGSGAAFSLFPPDNATGNFVRVVQRLPVRIRFAHEQNVENRIRPGMSTRVTIDTTRYVRKGAHEW